MSDEMVTTEDEELFRKCFPSCVDLFMVEKQRLVESKASEGDDVQMEGPMVCMYQTC